MILAIMSSLVIALYHLLANQDDNGSLQTVKALTLRIVLSIGLFGGLFIAFYHGYLTPHGVWG
ncbi:MAG: DUF2909 domain-containing protein [Francisellaceae bacterium]|nr:DUF2909 domain-containing protein [Francisellaceae bacterium]MBT6207370.1 DUF2909 domain-containing protein [Francisellaceae bacterium]MBT6538234.1 DUF2909 domain-containing protein [Francisellaceae bacterium]